MPEHPSLALPFVDLPPFEPRLTMDPYKPCWCGSGNKWKWCHKDREKQLAVNIHERLAAMRAAYQQGYCSHPEASSAACSDEIVRAHTVQRARGLAAIAENGHVVSALSASQDLFKNEGELVPREVGVRSASTFPGFCNRHDTSMFRPVESGTGSITAEVAFLLSFRSVSYELFMKRVQLKTLQITREVDKGKPFADQCQIQEHLYYSEAGVRLGLGDLEQLKRVYDAGYRQRRYDAFNYYAVRFADVLPLVGSWAFHPEFDFAGRFLQQLGRGTNDYELVVANLTVLDGCSVLVIAWTDPAGGPACQFAESFSTVPDDHKADAVVRFAFEHSENVYMRPSWWFGLPSDQKQAVLRRMGSGSEFNPPREASCLLPDGHNYVPRTEVVQKVQNGLVR